MTFSVTMPALGESVTEGTVTVNLIMEGLEGDEMRRKPTPAGEALITRPMFHRMLLMVGTSVVVIFGFFVWRLSSGIPFELVRTETFTLLAVTQWFNALNCRSPLKSTLSFDVFKNLWLVGGLALANVMHLLVVYTGPMNHVFHTVPIPIADFFLIGLIGSTLLWVEEARKWRARRRLERTSYSVVNHSLPG